MAMPQCRRDRHKHGKRTQGPDDEAEGGRECETSASRITTSGRADVFPFDVFLAAWLPRRPSAPGFPVIRARWTRIGPPEAPKWSNLHVWSQRGALPARKRQPTVANPRIPSSSRLLRNVVGGFSHAWDGQSAPSVPHWDSSARRQRPSHQDPRRVHPCPSR